MAQQHTIILLQSTPDKATRTWLDSTTVSKAMAVLFGLFEKQLKLLYPHAPEITYDLRDMYQWLDQLPEASAFTFDKATNSYVPWNKAWVKEQAGAYLRNQARR